MRWPRRLMLGVSAGLVTLLSPAAAAGHGLSAKVFLSERKVTVEVQYSDTSPASHATVKVYGYRLGQPSSDQPLLLEGELDPEGKYAFVPQVAQDLYFVIDDNAGHRAEVQVLAKSLGPLFDRGRETDPGGAVDPIAISPGPLFMVGAPLWGKILIGIAAILCLCFLLGWMIRRAKPN